MVWYHTSLCLVTSVFSYTKIFFTLRHHQLQVQGHVQQPNQTNHLNIARYKKAVSTTLWLQLTLVACYLPYGVVAALVTNGGLSSTPFLCAWTYTTTLVFVNSSLNPILYWWKLEEVRQQWRTQSGKCFAIVFRLKNYRPKRWNDKIVQELRTFSEGRVINTRHVFLKH